MIDEARPASSLAIALFGPLDVRLEGRPLPTPRSQKTHWLLALLALQEGRAVERAWLASLLWPDSTEQQAATNLRISLWQLRRALGPEAHRLEMPSSGKLRLKLVGAEADVLVFDEAIARGDAPSLEQAVALHRGPLLQGCVEEWVLEERELREQAYLGALETLAAHAMARGDPTAAAHYLRRLVVADPLRDSAQRALMQALAAAGDVAAATQVYRDFRLHLHQEMNAAPDPETTALYQQIRADARARAATGRPDTRAPAVGVAVSARPVSPSPRPLVSPSRRLPVAPHRLPRPLTRLVGREKEVEAVRARLEDAPLVTLTGPGGIGKTRLAIRVAERLAEELPDGVWFVDLAPLPSASPERPGEEVSALVSRTVARVLSVPEQPNQPATMSLVEALRDRHSLLVLDNCEHLLDACASLAQTLLESCPHLRILTTSRQPSGLMGEVVWRVSPLSLPEGSRQRAVGSGRSAGTTSPIPNTQHPTPDTLLQYSAVRLFLERAVAAAPGFRVTERDAETVAEVCRRLDGIPLAIELAATRLKALSMEELAARLEDRFRLLIRGSRTAPPRQQTLQATMDWSYGLLPEPEQTLLRRLSVFAGGWTLKAAEAVCGEGCRVQGVGGREQPDATTSTLHLIPHTLHHEDVLDLLTSLVEKSLVQYEEQEGEGRYRLLETVRQYARDRLLEAREAPSARGRHLSFFLRLVQEAGPKLLGGEQAVWLDRLEREHDNLLTAIEWSLEAEEGWKEGLALMRDLFTYWDLRSRFGGALEYLKRFVTRSTDWPIEERAKALRLTGFVAMKQADYPAARRYFEESRTLRRQQGVTDEDPRDLQCYGALALHEGDYAQAAALLQQGLRIYRRYQEVGTEFELNSLGWILDSLGFVAYHRGESQSARSYYEQSLTLFREADDKTGSASALLGLGRIAMGQGEYARARALMQESLSLFRDVKVKHSIVWALNSLAWVCWHEGEYSTARAHLVEALSLCREAARHWETIDTLLSAGHLAHRQGNPARAVRHFAAAEGLRTAIGEAMPPVDRAEYEASITAVRSALGEEAFAAAWAEGKGMTVEQAVAYALERWSRAGSQNEAVAAR